MADKPNGDIWNITDRDTKSQHYDTNFRFDFSYISSKEIKDIIKDYTWHNYIAGNKTLNTLYGEMKCYFPHLVEYADTKGITTLKTLDYVTVDEYISYLHTYISTKTRKTLSYSTQKKCLDTLKSLVRWCQIHKPESVPATEIFTGNEYNGLYKKLRVEFIPDDVVTQINTALVTEENPYLKYGIIILQSTGMRIGDLLKLRTDCIKKHLISGYTIEWFQHKGKKNKEPMPVRNECVDAVEKLIEITAEIRDEANEKDKDLLMIHRPAVGLYAGTVKAVEKSTFAREWLKKFIRKNDIKDADGNYYNLTCHQFRRTLGTDMLSKGVNINVIQKVLGHQNPRVTEKFYADVKDRVRAETFNSIGIIGNINRIQRERFDSTLEFEWFKANKDKCIAGLSDGYCTKPVTDGRICERLLKRQKCYTCSRYITTPEFLDAHRKHLESLERQVAEGVIYGKHYAEHFIPTIETLKVIIERLEAMHDEN